jgi:hypothetical protein
MSIIPSIERGHYPIQILNIIEQYLDDPGSSVSLSILFVVSVSWDHWPQLDQGFFSKHIENYLLYDYIRLVIPNKINSTEFTLSKIFYYFKII